MTSGKFHDHFSAVAKCYADYRPSYPAELFNFLATLAPPEAVVWDCAAGNGQATLDLAERFSKVIATDASEDQISAARPHPKVEYRVARAEESGLQDRSVHLVTVAQAVHWFAFDRFYSEVKRVLQPAGLLALWAYGINSIEGEEANRLGNRYYHETVRPYWPPERRMIEEGYSSIPFPFVEIAAPSFGMSAQWTLEELLGYFSTWSATNRYIKENGSNPIELLREELKAVWGPSERKRLITWPLSLRVGRVDS